MKNRSLVFITVLLLSLGMQRAVAQQYCIDAGEYLDWLCFNVRGAQQACSAQRIHGPFPSFDACETKRTSTLPYDMRWQRMTKCIPCGPSSPGQQRPSPPATSPFSEEQRITQKIENMRKDLTARGCTQKHLNFFEKTARSMKDYGQDLKTFELVLDANFQTVVRDCESKKKLMKIIEEEKREKDRLMKAKVALLHKIKKAPIYTSSIQVKYPPLNPSLMEVSKKDAPMIDGRDSRILSKIAEWYKSGIKNVAIDWLTEKTNLPIDKIDKALSVGSLIKEAVVEPVFSYLEEVKLSLGNSAQWEALVIRSYEVVEEAEKSISNEAKSTLAEEFIGGIPVVGGLLNKFYSAGRTSLEIWEERK